MEDHSGSETTAGVVWDTADKCLRDVVEEWEYGDYIRPFTVLRRLKCILADTKDEVVSFGTSLGCLPAYLVDFTVKDKFGLSFYNFSLQNLTTIALVHDNVDKLVLSYVSGFSINIADVWNSLDFSRRVAILASEDRFHDGLMKAMAAPDDFAVPAFDPNGRPALLDGCKVTKRVPMSKDKAEHMESEVLPFVSDLQWNESKAKCGNEIPLKWLFYFPETPRPMAEIDDDVRTLIGELAEMFKTVSSE